MSAVLHYQPTSGVSVLTNGNRQLPLILWT